VRVETEMFLIRKLRITTNNNTENFPERQSASVLGLASCDQAVYLRKGILQPDTELPRDR
jgi:hypothetical protein